MRSWNKTPHRTDSMVDLEQDWAKFKVKLVPVPCSRLRDQGQTYMNCYLLNTYDDRNQRKIFGIYSTFGLFIFHNFSWFTTLEMGTFIWMAWVFHFHKISFANVNKLTGRMLFNMYRMTIPVLLKLEKWKIWTWQYLPIIPAIQSWRRVNKVECHPQLYNVIWVQSMLHGTLSQHSKIQQ